MNENTTEQHVKTNIDNISKLSDKFIKVDGNKVVNVEFIRWIEKKDECFSICSKMDGCGDFGVSRVCKNNNPSSYDYLLKLFQ